MARSFKLPDLGEGIHEAEVLAVLVAVGDMVKEGDSILEVETDKAAVEIPSPFSGAVQDIRVKTGDLVKVGDVLMTFRDGDEAESALLQAPAVTAKPPDVAAESRRERGPVPASPATRRLARELGVDLYRVTPSGPAGLVTAEDVRASAEKGAPSPEPAKTPEEKPVEMEPAMPDALPLPDFSKWGPTEQVPIRSIRRATARHMALAWSQIPHVTSQDVVDVTKLEAFRRRHKADIEAKGGKLTITVFALKAAATALKTFPNFNATLDSNAGVIIMKHYYHLGVAVDTENGLIVPVIRDVDRKSIVELSIELNELIQRTRARKTTLEEMQGGTFTITNIGSLGGGHFAPIINYPEVAILGMGAARMQPVVREKGQNRHEIVPRLILPLVLSIDHRVLDGGDAARFMRLVINALEDPDELLMTMI